MHVTDLFSLVVFWAVQTSKFQRLCSGPFVCYQLHKKRSSDFGLPTVSHPLVRMLPKENLGQVRAHESTDFTAVLVVLYTHIVENTIENVSAQPGVYPYFEEDKL